MQFRPFVYDAMNQQVPVAIEPMTPQDAATTTKEPRWQTDWTSEYISKGKFDIYGLKTQIGELVALGAYEISEDVVTVHIVYMESQAQSNPTLCERPKYHGIGRALIAYGIKLSVDAGFNGDVTLDAKTPELARHYERDFGALLIPGRERGAAPRYLICDEAARDIFVSYLEEGGQWKTRSGTSHMKQKKTDYGTAPFLQCAENSACHGRKPAKNRRLSLRKSPESIMREKRQNEI